SEEAARAYRRAYPGPLDPVDPYVRRLFTETRTQHLPYVEGEVGVSDGFRERARISGNRSMVGVPMLRDGRVIGTLFVARAGPDLSPQPFSDREIRLLEAFADQAVENVRLFNELDARNRDLTATSEILQVIASSPTDTQPVFDAIARSVVQLCEGLNTYLFLFDGEKYRVVACLNASPETLAYLQR